MKQMRFYLLILALGFGLCAQRVQAQTSEQVMTFSVICQYATNYLITTNTQTGATAQYIEQNTVILDSANIAKAIAVDLLRTNWTLWAGAQLCYEVNLATGNQGIFMRLGAKQTNVSQFFTNIFSPYAYSNIFSQNLSSVFTVTNYTSLPVGVFGTNYVKSTTTNFYGSFSDNLAYLTFTSSNMSFNLFGYSQGTVVDGSGYLDGTLYSQYLTEAEIAGAGTFNLNVSTNIFLVPTTNGTPAFYNGVAHGTVFVQRPFFLAIGPPEGP
jgi:hypothetical protein